MTSPGLGETLVDKLTAQRTTRAGKGAQGAAVSVDFAPAALDRELAGIEQFGQAARRTLRQFDLGRALRMTEFGRIDIGEADLRPAIPDRVAIDDASNPR